MKYLIFILDDVGMHDLECFDTKKELRKHFNYLLSDKEYLLERCNGLINICMTSEKYPIELYDIHDIDVDKNLHDDLQDLDIIISKGIN